MKFVIVLLLAALVCSISASPSDSNLEPEPKPEPEPTTSSNGARSNGLAPSETDGSEMPSRGGIRPRCILFTRLFGNDVDGNGGYLNRRFPLGLGSFFNSDRSGFDGGLFNRRYFTPFVSRGNRGNGRGGYNPNNDQPDSRDIEFVQS